MSGTVFGPVDDEAGASLSSYPKNSRVIGACISRGSWGPRKLPAHYSNLV